MPIERSLRQKKKKINKETSALNDMLDKLGLTDIYKRYHPKAMDTTSSQVYTEHFLGYIMC